MHQMYLSDPICAMVVSALIFVSVLPLIQLSCENLLLKSPVDTTPILKVLEQIDGVKELEDLKVFQISQEETHAILRYQLEEVNPN